MDKIMLIIIFLFGRRIMAEKVFSREFFISVVYSWKSGAKFPVNPNHWIGNF